MNINDMSLEQAADATIRISDAVSFVLEDPEVAKLLDDISQSDTKNLMEWISRYLPRIARAVLQRHRDSFYEIVGALSLQSKEKVGQMNFREAVNLLQENWEILMGFFTSSGSRTEPDGTQPANA